MLKEKEYIGILKQVLEKPGMYKLQKVEDVEVFIRAEIIVNRNSEVNDWLINFSSFVVRRIDPKLVDFDWCKIIRLYSGSDSHSIQLFKGLFDEFTSQE